MPKVRGEVRVEAGRGDRLASDSPKDDVPSRSLPRGVLNVPLINCHLRPYTGTDPKLAPSTHACALVLHRTRVDFEVWHFAHADSAG